jgi:hypothetical protein
MEAARGGKDGLIKVTVGMIGLIGSLACLAQTEIGSDVSYSCDVFIDLEQRIDCINRLAGKPKATLRSPETTGTTTGQGHADTLQKRRQAFETLYRNVQAHNSGVFNYEDRSEWPMNLSTMLREEQERKQEKGD